MFKRAIVGVDGSKAGWTAVEYAFEFGKRLDIPVLGLHVVDERLIDESFLEDLAGVLGFTFYYGISAKVKEFLETQADAVLDEFLALGRKRGVKVSSFQAVGVPYREVLSQADKEDIIFLGKRGKRPIRGFLLGSNSEIIARRSPCPIFLSQEEYRDIKKVCLAYDGQDISKKALNMLKRLKTLFGFEINVIHVGEEDLQKEIGDVDRYENLKGLPEEKITQYCEEGMDMLVMGAFSKGRLKETVFGSVTSFVLHHVNIPVFLVK